MLICEKCGNRGDARGESGVRIVSVKRLGIKAACERCAQQAAMAEPASDLWKAEQKRKRANARRRARYNAMRSLGMVKTPYGWE